MERLTDEQIEVGLANIDRIEEKFKLGAKLEPSAELFDHLRLALNELRYYKQLSEKRGKALGEMAESDDDWYVGRTPMKEYAREALQEDTP